MLAMLLLALAVTQGLGLLLFTDERNRAVRAALGGLEAAGRAANVVLLLDYAPIDAPFYLLVADLPLVRFNRVSRRHHMIVPKRTGYWVKHPA